MRVIQTKEDPKEDAMIAKNETKYHEEGVVHFILPNFERNKTQKYNLKMKKEKRKKVRQICT